MIILQHNSCLLTYVYQCSIFSNVISVSPVSIYLFSVSNGNTRTICEICSKLPIKKRRSVLFFVNFEDISHIPPVFPLLTVMSAGLFQCISVFCSNCYSPGGIYLFKVNNGMSVMSIMSEISSKFSGQ